MGATNFSFIRKLSSIHRYVPYFFTYVISLYHSFDWKRECHWSTSYVHAILIEKSNGGFITTVFAKYNKIWELSFLNSPEFYHCQYFKLVYSPMFSSPKPRIYRFAKVLPRQIFALCGIIQLCGFHLSATMVIHYQ